MGTTLSDRAQTVSGNALADRAGLADLPFVDLHAAVVLRFHGESSFVS